MIGGASAPDLIGQYVKLIARLDQIEKQPPGLGADCARIECVRQLEVVWHQMTEAEQDLAEMKVIAS